MFRLAGDELEKAVRGGGFERVRMHRLEFRVPFDSVEQRWQIFSEMAPPLKAAREALGPDELDQLKAAIGENLRPFQQGERVLLPARCVCALATQ